MSYANFIPTVWNEGINRELERLCVFAEDCNREYEGSIKEKGESVVILGVGKPTIKKFEKSARNNDIEGPEEVEDTSSILYINQGAYFNYMVGDIDRAQAAGKIMDVLSQETSEGLANEMDAYIAGFAADSSVKPLYGKTPQKITADVKPVEGEKYVLDVVDSSLQSLYENDVKPTTPIVLTVSPRFFTLFRKAYRFEDTQNSEILKHGRVGMYNNVTVKMSNNVFRSDAGATDNIMIRTKRAIAFANPFTHSEAYRPEKKFADAVKGYILYDAKVVRPKEIININVKYA